MHAESEPPLAPRQIVRHRNGPSIRLVMLGFVLALGGLIGAGALLHPATPLATLAGRTLAQR